MTLSLNEPFRWGASPQKAVTGAGVIAYYQDLPLSLLSQEPQQKAATFLRAYKVGWFHKAGRKISTDIASLGWSLSDGDAESEDPAETVIPKPDLDIPFAALNPIEQLIRLLEKPNPYQTGKQLFQKTQIRKDFGGVGFWYLENGAGGGLPTAFYGISPSRLWAARNAQGIIIGWVLDKNKPSGGVPFDADEIVPFSMPSADDDDIFGVGVVESVYAETPLSDLMARHSADLLTTGGRLAGMISPKDRSLSEDEFQDAVRAWRNVASDPNAARRLLLFPEPMEYAAGASTPAEIGIPELAALNRDNILTAFPIAPEMLGTPMPSGLNASGESRIQLRRFYWEDTIHPRVDDLEEVIQVQIVSRYERAMGQTFDFDIEEPDLDDADSILQKVAAYKALVQSGFDDKEARMAAGLDHIKYVAVPSLMDPVAQAAAAQAATDALTATAVENQRRGTQVGLQEPVAKSRAETRKQAEAQATALGKTHLETFFQTQRDRIVARIRESMPRTKADRKAEPADWWNATEEDSALLTTLQNLYVKVGFDALQLVADEIGRVIIRPNTRRVLSDLVQYGGSRITDINARTRDAVVAQLAEGVRRGYSINQLIDGVPAEGYAGVAKAVMDNGEPVFDAYRAEMIARTETALSFNRAALTGYKEFQIAEVQAIDGDGDEVCAERDGRIYSIDDAYGIEDHPNGTLDWVPIVNYQEKSVREPLRVKVEPHISISLPAITNNLPEPVVTVTNEVAVPEVTVKAPEVTVTNEVVTPTVNVTNDVAAPVVNVAAPEVSVTNEVAVPSVTVTNDVKTPTVVNQVETPSVTVNNKMPTKAVEPAITVNMPAEMRITGMPDRMTRRVVKREKGQIIETTDVETDA